MHRFSVIAFLVVLPIGVGQAYAADFYSVSAGGDLDWHPDSGGFGASGFGPVSAGPVEMFDGFGSANVSARAAEGLAGGSIQGHFSVLFPSSRRFNPKVRAFASSEIVFDGDTPTVQASVNLNMNGGMTLNLQPATFFVAARGSVSMGFQIVNQLYSFSSGVDMNGQTIPINHFTGLNVAASQFTLFVGGRGTSPTFTVPTGVPVQVSFTLETSFGLYTDLGQSFFNSNFNNTMSFATRGPVFNLPPGYTVNGFGIVDNRFGVPEPSTGLWALLMLGAVRLRRRRPRVNEA